MKRSLDAKAIYLFRNASRRFSINAFHPTIIQLTIRSLLPLPIERTQRKVKNEKKGKGRKKRRI